MRFSVDGFPAWNTWNVECVCVCVCMQKMSVVNRDHARSSEYRAASDEIPDNRYIFYSRSNRIEHATKTIGHFDVDHVREVKRALR